MVTRELLLQKIKEQVTQADELVNDPVLFKEALKRVELLCELVTEPDAKQHSTKVSETNLTKPEKNPSQQVSSDLTGDSIFDF